MKLKTAAPILLGAALIVSTPLAGFALQTPPPSAPAARPLDTSVSAEDLAARLDALIPRLMKDGYVPGLSLAVVRGGRIWWQRAYGVKDASTNAPIDDRTVFEAASLSKPVFAYAVLRLVDAGLIDLDTPVVKYLPGDYADDPRIRLITPRHLLSHTAGFPNWRSSRELPIAFTPGERFSYSGEGFVYLQKAVERATGQTLDALVKRLVFGPLGMTSSSYTWEERFEGRKATGHDSVGTPLPIRRPAEASAAATLHTTTADYARFLTAALEGSGLAKKTYAEMLRPQVRVDEGCSNCIVKKPTGRLSRDLAWGLGWGLQETGDGLSVWHWGDNGSGFHCYVVGYPRERLGVVIFTNSLGGHGMIPDLVEAAIGGRHPAFSWIDYERYNSPAKALFTEILAEGAPAIARYRNRKSEDGPKLTEQQVNRVGYWLLSKKKIKESIAVFESNVADFPRSWNVYDSLGEACAADGQRQRAIENYEESIALNPENANAVEQLRKLREQPPHQ